MFPKRERCYSKSIQRAQDFRSSCAGSRALTIGVLRTAICAFALILGLSLASHLAGSHPARAAVGGSNDPAALAAGAYDARRAREAGHDSQISTVGNRTGGYADRSAPAEPVLLADHSDRDSKSGGRGDKSGKGDKGGGKHGKGGKGGKGGFGKGHDRDHADWGHGAKRDRRDRDRRDGDRDERRDDPRRADDGTNDDGTDDDGTDDDGTDGDGTDDDGTDDNGTDGDGTDDDGTDDDGTDDDGTDDDGTDDDGTDDDGTDDGTDDDGTDDDSDGGLTTLDASDDTGVNAANLDLSPLQIASQCFGSPTFSGRYFTGRPSREEATVCLAAVSLGAFAGDRVSIVDVANAVLSSLTTPLDRPDTRRAALEDPGPAEGIHAVPAAAPRGQRHTVLEDPDPRNRRRAASAIGRMNAALDTAIPTVLDALCTRDGRVRRRAERIATGIGQYAEKASPALADRVANDDDSVVTRAAVQALGALGVHATAALPTLVGVLEDNDLGVRYYAGNGVNNVDSQMTQTVQAIQRISNRCYEDWGGTVQELAARLQQDRAALRQKATQSLANIGPTAQAEVPRWSAALEQRQDRERAVRALSDTTTFSSAAVNALTKGGRVPGTDLEVAVGAGPLAAAVDDDQVDIRYAAVTALRETNKEVNDAWIALERAPKYDPTARRAANQALQTIDEYRSLAVTALLAAVKDEDVEVQRSAVQAMAGLGGQAGDSIPALVEAVKSGPDEVRPEAALALGQIGAAPADGRENRGLIVPTLVDALDDTDPAVQYRAAQALGLLEGKADPAVPKLRELLGDDDIALRHQAARSLEAIDPEAEFGRVEEVSAQTEQQVAALLSAVKGDDPAPRREAIRTLSNLGPTAMAALPDLAARLTSSEPEARRRVARSLQEVSSRALEETPQLIGDLQGDGPAADRAARALGDLGVNANLAQRDLIEALNDPDPEVRLIVAEILGEISGAMSAVIGALLVESLEDDREAVAALQRVSGLSGG